MQDSHTPARPGTLPRSAPSIGALLAWLLLSPMGASAQNGSLQGIVAVESSGQVLVGALVAIESGGVEVRSVLTDRNGLYLIGGVAPGTYTLRVRFLGYAPYERSLTVAAGTNLTVNIGLQIAPIALESIDVEFELPEVGVVIRDLGRQTVTPGELRRIPTPAASGDLATLLQTLPGVVTTGDRGGHLFVRGGTHTENLALMDGLLVYQPFHIVGGFSVFPEDLLASADFYAGGFGARYQGRTSSVLDVQMRDGDRSEYKGGGSIGPVVAEVTAEGPLGRRAISWLVSARRSLLDETGESLLGEPVPLTFESQFLKVTSFTDDPHSRCALTALRSADHGRMDPKDEVSRVGWENLAIGARCVALLSEGRLRLVEASAGYSSVNNESIARSAAELESQVSRLHLDANFSSLVGSRRLDWGWYVRLEEMSYRLVELYGATRGEGDLWASGAYIEPIIVDGARLSIVPGAVFSIQPTPAIEPRLRFSWRPRGRDSGEVTGAFGLYRQALVGISDIRDASSVFVAWKPYTGEEPVTATHAQVGWQQSVGDLNWSVEGYLRRMRNISIPLWQASADYNTQLILAEGRGHGVDARIEYARGGFYGFVGYGYGVVRYEATHRNFEVWYDEPTQRFHPPHDRRHQANVVASMEVSGFELGVRWQLGSGLPYTRPMGFDEFFDSRFFLPLPAIVFGETRVIVDKPYLGRLPTMHRLDLSVQRDFELSFGRLDTRGGVMNAYDRTNVFYYDVFLNRRVDQLPLFPYLAVKFTGG